MLKLTKPPHIISFGENYFCFYEKFKDDSEDRAVLKRFLLNWAMGLLDSTDKHVAFK